MKTLLPIVPNCDFHIVALQHAIDRLVRESGFRGPSSFFVAHTDHLVRANAIEREISRPGYPVVFFTSAASSLCSQHWRVTMYDAETGEPVSRIEHCTL